MSSCALRALFKRRELVAELIDLNEATREVIALVSGELRRSRVIVQHRLLGSDLARSTVTGYRFSR